MSAGCAPSEPLPRGHALAALRNVTITPHFATNTTFVRQQLVEDVGKMVITAFDHKAMGLEVEEKNKAARGLYAARTLTQTLTLS